MYIELLRDGEVIAETVTDQYGFYRFVDLYPARNRKALEALGLLRPSEETLRKSMRETGDPELACVGKINATRCAL